MTRTLLLAAAVLLAPAALAQTVSTAGHSVYTSAHRTTTALPTGDTVLYDHATGMLLSDGPAPADPFHLSTHDCLRALTLSAGGDVLTHTSTCVATDADGDTWTLSYSSAGEPTGTWRVTGGTGKYAGMTGTGTAQAIGGAADGRFALRWTADYALPE